MNRHCLVNLQTFVNVDFQDLLLAFHFVAIAVLASVFGAEALPLSLAVRTHALDLLDHSRSDLLHLDLNAPPFAI